MELHSPSFSKYAPEPNLGGNIPAYWVTSQWQSTRTDLKQIMEALYGPQGRSELARAIGVSPSTITMVLSGDRDVTDKLELKLLRQIDHLLMMKLFAIYQVMDIAESMGNRLLPGANFKLAPLLTREEYEEEVRAITSGAGQRG